MRVSDEEIQMVINDMDGEWELDEQFALDLRDARVLLREALEQMERLGEVMDPQSYVQTVTAFNTADVLRRIRQHLEGEE